MPKTNNSLPARRLFNYKEAARYIGASERALRRWVPAGKVPYIKFPGSSRVLFDPAALDRFLADSTFTPPDA